MATYKLVELLKTHGLYDHFVEQEKRELVSFGDFQFTDDFSLALHNYIKQEYPAERDRIGKHFSVVKTWNDKYMECAAEILVMVENGKEVARLDVPDDRTKKLCDLAYHPPTKEQKEAITLYIDRVMSRPERTVYVRSFNDSNLRKAAKRRGLKLEKFSSNFVPRPGWGNGYRICKMSGEVIAGEKFEMTLEDVRQFLNNCEKVEV